MAAVGFRWLRGGGEGFDDRHCIVGEVVRKIVQRSGCCEFLADPRNQRIIGVSTRPAFACQRPVASIEVYDGDTLVLVFLRFKRQLPRVGHKLFHVSIIEATLQRRQGRTSLVR